MAKTYLDAGDTYQLATSNTFLYGGTGNESVVLLNGVTGTTLDQNVERTVFSGAKGTYLYQQTGNILNVYSGNTLLCRIPVKSGVSTLSFADGDLVAGLSAAGMTVGGSGISNVAPDILGARNVGSSNDASGTLATQAQQKSFTVAGIQHESLLSGTSTIVQALESQGSWPQGGITYSYNSSIPADYAGVQTDSSAAGNLVTGWQTPGSTLRTTMDGIMAEVNRLTGLTISYTSGNGDIRFNMLPMASGVAAFAYTPGSGVGGDIFINTTINTSKLGTGSYNRSILTHELGHALGLQHPFSGNVTLPDAEDVGSNTIMSYTWKHYQVPVLTILAGKVNIDYQEMFSSGFMVYDIAALQHLYGPDTSTNSGNTTYTFGTTPFYTSLWDAGGVDTIDLSTTTARNIVSLKPGSYSSINYQTAEEQLAIQQANVRAALGNSSYDSWLANMYGNKDDLYTGENALGIAYGAVIENVIGGSAADTIYDNNVDNALYGGAGNDLFYLGAGGFDTIHGESGSDKVVLAMASGNVRIETGTQGTWLVADNFSALLVGVESIQFSDTALALDVNGNAGQAYRIYQAAFDRSPDTKGLGYWIARMEEGADLEAVAASFIASGEFQALYGTNPSSATLINAFYQNILHRAPDDSGFQYWLHQLDSGQLNAAQVLASFSESAENRNNLMGIIGAGIHYDTYDSYA